MARRFAGQLKSRGQVRAGLLDDSRMHTDEEISKRVGLGPAILSVLNCRWQTANHHLGVAAERRMAAAMRPRGDKIVTLNPAFVRTYRFMASFWVGVASARRSTWSLNFSQPFARRLITIAYFL